MFHARHAATIALSCGLATGLRAQTVHPEVEPNDNKPQALANGPVVLDQGDTITGTTTGSTTTGTGVLTSADYFLLKTVPLPLGIYRNRMLFSQTGPAGHFTQLRGLSQWDSVINYFPGPSPTGSNTDDATANFSQTTATALTPARTLTWYGFGREEQVYDRVTGAAATTGTYTLTYERTPITPTDLGVFTGGFMTVTTAGQGHTSDTEIWIYDSNFRPIPGFNNDNVGISTTPGGANSTLTRDFVNGGVYYIALGGQNLANNLPSPTDDKMRSVFVYEFPDMLSCSSNTANLNCAFTLTDGAGVTTQYPSGGGVNVTRAEPQEILWYKITLTPPVTGACCLPDGSCTTATLPGCNNSGGTFALGTPCGSVNCPQPATGACCTADANCSVISSYACAAAGGVWQGAATACGGCKHTLDFFPAAAPGPVANSTAVFFDITAGAEPIVVSGFDYYTAQGTHSAVGGPEGMVYVQPGATYQFNMLGPDNNTAPIGWSLNTSFTFPANPGAWTPLHVDLTSPVAIPAGQTTAFYLATRFHGVRIGGLLNPADPQNYSNSDASGYSAHGHNGLSTMYPYWGTAATTPRVLIGRTYYSVSSTCYPNCDSSTTAPILNVLDFSCFLNRFAAGDTYANCDGSTTPPVLNVLDFSCFLNSFAAGCS